MIRGKGITLLTFLGFPRREIRVISFIGEIDWALGVGEKFDDC